MGSYFPFILETFGGGFVFAIFAFFMLLQLVWVIRFVPETKGVPLEEIELKLGIRNKS